MIVGVGVVLPCIAERYAEELIAEGAAEGGDEILEE